MVNEIAASVGSGYHFSKNVAKHGKLISSLLRGGGKQQGHVMQRVHEVRTIGYWSWAGKDAGYRELTRPLETAREKFLNRSLDIRQGGFEKLWNAWERLKMMNQVKGARESVLPARLEIEARELNFIGTIS